MVECRIISLVSNAMSFICPACWLGRFWEVLGKCEHGERKGNEDGRVDEVIVGQSAMSVPLLTIAAIDPMASNILAELTGFTFSHSQTTKGALH